MIFSKYLNVLEELETEPAGTNRSYWHFNVQKESNDQYALYWRHSCFAKCDNISTCISICLSVYLVYKIEFE